MLYRAELGVDGWWHTVWKGPGHARLLGLPAALLEDLDFFDEVWYGALHPDDREVYLAAWNSLRPDHPMEVVYRIVSRDGTVRWLADRAKARHTPDGAIIADSISIDVTEHRRVTDELAAARLALEQIAAEGEQRLDGLLAAADAGFAVLEVEAGHCRVRFADPSLAQRLLGQPLPAGVDVGAAIFGALEHDERERLVSAFAADDRFVVDSRLRGLDGVVRSFAVEGAVDRPSCPARGAADVFLVVREISRDPRIAALLDAVDEPVYELELGADGIWRTTAGTGIARLLGVKGADERVLAAAVLDDDRAAVRGTPRAPRGRAGVERRVPRPHGGRRRALAVGARAGPPRGRPGDRRLRRRRRHRLASRSRRRARAAVTAAEFEEAMRRHALTLPEAYEDRPWGHPVFKLPPNKVFVFMSEGEDPVRVTVKLDAEEREAALTQPFIVGRQVRRPLRLGDGRGDRRRRADDGAGLGGRELVAEGGAAQRALLEP